MENDETMKNQDYLEKLEIIVKTVLESLLLQKPDDPIPFIIKHLAKNYPEQAHFAYKSILSKVDRRPDFNVNNNSSESHISARGAFKGEGDIVSNSDELRNTAELNSSKKALESVLPGHHSTHMVKISVDDNSDPWYYLHGRPVRSGIWFICHQDSASLFPYEESVDIYETFFKVHPNGSEFVKGFLAVRMADTSILEHSHSICMSSYRWANVKPVQQVLPAGVEVDFSCPDNYMWFLEHIRKEKKLGWMDFVANVGVNCPTGPVIEYMGGLYAKFPTLGWWTLDLETFEVARTRGWIFQEMTFGPLEEFGLRALFKQLRDQVLEVKSSKSKESTSNLIKMCQSVAYLLYRRGFLYWAEVHNPPYFARFTWDRYGGGSWLWKTASFVQERFQLPRELLTLLEEEIKHRASLTMVSILDVLSSHDGDVLAEFESEVIQLVSKPAYLLSDNVDEFGNIFAEGMVNAFLETFLFSEKDRENAIFSVASAILRDSFDCIIHPNEMALWTWKRCCERILSVLSSRTYPSCIVEYQVNSRSTDERGALGFGMNLKGTKLMNDGTFMNVSSEGGRELKRRVDYTQFFSHLGDSIYRSNKYAETIGEVFICLPGNDIMEICRKYNVTCVFYVLRDMESHAIVELVEMFHKRGRADQFYPAEDVIF